MNVDTRDLISVTDANTRGVSKLVADAETGNPQIIMKNSKPAAAVVSMRRYEELTEAQENAMLLIATLARLLSDNGRRHSLDDVAAEFGIDLDDESESED